jgi:hypothetical protein
VLSGEERELMRDYAPTQLGQPTSVYDVNNFRVFVYDFNIMEKLYDGGPIVTMQNALPADARQGKLELCPAMLEIPENEPLSIPLQIWNMSQTTWSSAGNFPVRVGAHLLDHDGSSPVRPDILRAPLPGTLQGGEQVEVIIDLPPVAAGDYLLSVDLVQDGVAWFNNACRIHLSVR